jgi:hypothetical protein
MFFWNEPRRLAQDRAAGSCVQLAMGRHGERLSCAVGKDPTELDVTAALGVDREAEPAEDSDNLRAGEAPETRHSSVSAPS